MTLKIYVDRMSQPSRAVLIFCKMNRIEFDEVRVNLTKREQLGPNYKDINPMGQIPALVDGRFKLFESHAILIYLACAFPGVADHWYPADLSKRAQYWIGITPIYVRALYVFNTTLAPVLGLPLDPQEAAKAEKLLLSPLYKIESYWLNKGGRFLLGSLQPSIADLSLACEIMQLEIVDEADRDRILGPFERVRQWIEDIRMPQNFILMRYTQLSSKPKLDIKSNAHLVSILTPCLLEEQHQIQSCEMCIRSQ